MRLHKHERYVPYSVQHSTKARLIRFLRYILLVFVCFQLISLSFCTSYRVETKHMEETLAYGDKVFVFPFLYAFNIFDFKEDAMFSPKRGDLVIYKNPLHTPQAPVRFADTILSFISLGRLSLSSFLYDENLQSQYQIGRIIAAPGDHVRVEKGVAYIRKAGVPNFQREEAVLLNAVNITPYQNLELWTEDMPILARVEPISLQENEFFILGDNRSILPLSYFTGAVKRSKIVGPVKFRWAGGFRVF